MLYLNKYFKSILKLLKVINKILYDYLKTIFYEKKNKLFAY